MQNSGESTVQREIIVMQKLLEPDRPHSKGHCHFPARHACAQYFMTVNPSIKWGYIIHKVVVTS